jgi:hypothetical protein
MHPAQDPAYRQGDVAGNAHCQIKKPVDKDEKKIRDHAQRTAEEPVKIKRFHLQQPVEHFKKRYILYRTVEFRRRKAELRGFCLAAGDRTVAADGL